MVFLQRPLKMVFAGHRVKRSGRTFFGNSRTPNALGGVPVSGTETSVGGDGWKIPTVTPCRTSLRPGTGAVRGACPSRAQKRPLAEMVGKFRPLHPAGRRCARGRAQSGSVPVSGTETSVGGDGWKVPTVTPCRTSLRPGTGAVRGVPVSGTETSVGGDGWKIPAVTPCRTSLRPGTGAVRERARPGHRNVRWRGWLESSGRYTLPGVAASGDGRGPGTCPSRAQKRPLAGMVGKFRPLHPAGRRCARGRARSGSMHAPGPCR